MATSADFIFPKGRITQAMFPGDTLSDNVDAWIAKASTLTSDSAALEAYVYYLAFQAVADRLNIEAASVDFKGQGGMRRLKDQVSYWQDLAEQQFARYSYLVGSSGRHTATGNASDAVFNETTLEGFTDVFEESTDSI